MQFLKDVVQTVVSREHRQISFNSESPMLSFIVFLHFYPFDMFDIERIK